MTIDASSLHRTIRLQMAPLGDRVLIRQMEQEKKTASGLIIASSSSTPDMSEARMGSVLAVGEDVKAEVKVGDTVMFSQYSTAEVRGGGIGAMAGSLVTHVLNKD